MLFVKIICVIFCLIFLLIFFKGSIIIRPMYEYIHVLNYFLLLLADFILLQLFRFAFSLTITFQTRTVGCSGCFIEAMERHDERRLLNLLSAANVKYSEPIAIGFSGESVQRAVSE